MKALKYLVWLMYPIIFIALFSSLLTTKTYMNISEGLYESHDGTGWRIDGTTYTYDYGYVSGQLIDYLNYRHDDLTFGATPDDDAPVMRDIEIRHMVDVRDVYTNVRIAGVIALLGVVGISTLFYFKSKQLLYETFRDIYIVPLFFVMFVGGWFMINFNAAFTIFHEIFFDNDDWLLRSGDVLIRILPQNFWLVSGMIILFLLTLSIAVTVWVSRKWLRVEEQ